MLDYEYIAKERDFKLSVMIAILKEVISKVNKKDNGLLKRKREKINYFVNDCLLRLVFGYSQEDILNDSAKFKVGKKVVKTKSIEFF